MLRKSVYPKIESTLNQAARFLAHNGFSPNQLTLTGLALSFLTGWIYASGNFFLAGLFLLIATSGDLLDGPLARLTGKASKFGAFLDSTVDRYGDFFLFGGVALFYAKQGEVGWFLITFGILLGSYVTSYAKARAENLIPDCTIGVFERAERIIGLALFSFFPPLRPLALWVLFIGTNVTAVQRILYTQKALRENNASPE